MSNDAAHRATPSRARPARTARPAAAAKPRVETGAVERGGAGGVQSVDRALTALEILARSGTAGVSEVAERIGVHKSTAFRLLAALEEHDLVRQAEDRGQYELGFGVLRLATSIAGRLDLVRQARPVMDALAHELGETVNVAVLRQNVVVNVGQSIGGGSIAAHNWIGELTPLHATSSGKVLLASLAPAERAGLALELTPYTERTLTDRAALEAELIEVARAGFASTHDEYELGLHAIAVPVRDHTGDVIAALSVAGPTYRFDDGRIEQIAGQVIDAGHEVSARLGHFGAG